MKRVTFTLILAAIAGCGDKITNQYTTIIEGPSTTVKATVLCWRCGVGDWTNNRLGPGKFDSSPSGCAKVTFEYINGNSHSEYTDDSSTVNVELPNGPYRIIVETQYTRPDTFVNYAISRDLSIDLDVVFEHWLADSIGIRFLYAPASDSLGYLAELRYLQKLCQLSDYVFEDSPVKFRRSAVTYNLFETPTTYVEYYCPIQKNKAAMTYQAIDKVTAAMAAAQTDSVFPNSMSFIYTQIFCSCGAIEFLALSPPFLHNLPMNSTSTKAVQL